MRPREYEQRVRQALVDRISSALMRNYPNGRIHCFGSFAAGLYLPTADMDIVFVSDQFKNRGIPAYQTSYRWMSRFFDTLVRAGIGSHDDVQIVAKAKVPIIKFIDQMTGLNVDISFENMSGVIANKTFQEWMDKYPAMPKLVPLIKQFLLMRDLNEVVNGGIGGLSISCLIVSFLQHHPAIQSGNMKQEHHLGQLLLDFFDLYGNKFNMATTAIMMNPPGYFPKFGQVCLPESEELPTCECFNHQ